MEIFFLNWFVLEAQTLTRIQFISVLIVGHHEEGQEGDDQAKQPSHIGECIVNFAILSLYQGVLGMENNIDPGNCFPLKEGPTTNEIEFWRFCNVGAI